MNLIHTSPLLPAIATLSPRMPPKSLCKMNKGLAGLARKPAAFSTKHTCVKILKAPSIAPLTQQCPLPQLHPAPLLHKPFANSTPFIHLASRALLDSHFQSTSSSHTESGTRGPNLRCLSGRKVIHVYNKIHVVDANNKVVHAANNSGAKAHGCIISLPNCLTNMFCTVPLMTCKLKYIA